MGYLDELYQSGENKVKEGGGSLERFGRRFIGQGAGTGEQATDRAATLKLAEQSGGKTGTWADPIIERAKEEQRARDEEQRQKDRRRQEYLDKIKQLRDDAAIMHWHSAGRAREKGRQIDTDVRRQLSGALAKTAVGANRRGLLGSGIQKAAEGQAIGTAGQSYAGEVARYNQYEQDLLKAYDNAALEAQQEQYVDKAGEADAAFRKSVEQAKKWEDARGSIFSGVGSILGGFLANG